jgi:hypothetical protein
MKAQAAFVGANRTVKLHAITSVNLNFAFVINPGNSERDGSFWFYDSFKNLALNHAGILLIFFPDGFDDFVNGLMKFGFVRVFGFYHVHEFSDAFHFFTFLSMRPDIYNPIIGYQRAT